MERIFNTDKRIKLGVWGLGRGLSLIRSAEFLNIDVVAGCDIHPHMRENFKKIAPNAFVTDDEDVFLARDFDAVLIATYFPDHSKHILKALAADKHVMCEVTPFKTMADAVKIVEAVEKGGKVFNLLENYPFTKENLFLRKLWQEGFFGEFQYAEFEYVHDCRTLSYAYNVDNGLPVEPGYCLHNWRSILDINYYNTHSLGPLMNITGLRPTTVAGTRCNVILPGYPNSSSLPHGTVAPQMITMSNGGVMRNLMGATSNDFHRAARLWGTNAAAENMHDDLRIRVGGTGNGTYMHINPKWPELGELAEKTGHGGGDFWELYYFARQVLTGEPAPWNIYEAADVTIAGILGARSNANGGVVLRIPDFRNKSERDEFRNDDYQFKYFDPEHFFPEGHDPAITGDFTTIMTRLFPMNSMGGIPLVKRALDGIKLYSFIANADEKLMVIKTVNKLIDELAGIADLCRRAEVVMNAYPDSLPGQTIKRVLDTTEMDKIYNTESTIAELKTWLFSN